MLVKDAQKLLHTVKADDKPSKANPCMTRKQVVGSVKKGLDRLLGSRGNIDLKDYCNGVLELRMNQLLTDK